MQPFAALLRKDNQPVRYLVVDDSVFARKNLIKMIEMFGGEVAGEAGDGLTAIAEFNRTKPDIVLMDITMPQMEGIEAVERIVRQHADARIVMVSSVGYQENILAALQKGAKYFVQKPVKPDVLYEILRYVLSDESAATAAAVLAETLQSPTKIGDLTLEQETYRRKGLAALILIKGEIEGRVILDLDPAVAVKVAGYLAGAEVQESEQIVSETVCEVANMVIGNSITLLNDQGFRFKVFPPEIHTSEEGLAGSQDTEAMVLCFETPAGNVYMNIAMRYPQRRRRERSAAPAIF